VRVAADLKVAHKIALLVKHDSHSVGAVYPFQLLCLNARRVDCNHATFLQNWFDITSVDVKNLPRSSSNPRLNFWRENLIKCWSTGNWVCNQCKLIILKCKYLCYQSMHRMMSSKIIKRESKLNEADPTPKSLLLTRKVRHIVLKTAATVISVLCDGQFGFLHSKFSQSIFWKSGKHCHSTDC